MSSIKKRSFFFSQSREHTPVRSNPFDLEKQEVAAQESRTQLTQEEDKESEEEERIQSKMIEESQKMLLGQDSDVEVEEIKERIETIKEQRVFQRKMEGANPKKHLGVWRYFIDEKSGKRFRAYISLEGFQLRGAEAIRIAEKDEKRKTEGWKDQEGDPKSLAYWGVPRGLALAFQHRLGIKELFDWQIKCLSNPDVLSSKRNLLYFAPTSAGKSLVAELLMLRAILRDKRRCIYVLPFVAIVQEKANQLAALYRDVNIKVEAMYSGSETSVWSPRIDICVCTLEKANAIATQLLTSQASATLLETFVFDEFHLVSDAHRGHSLEALIIKLKLAHFSYPSFRYQIIAMSATISAPEKLAEWIEADTFEGETRPATLFEYFKIGKTLYTREMQYSLKMDLQSSSPLGPLPNKVKAHHAEIAALSSFYLAKRKPVIVFCSTKNECHSLALSLAAILPRQFEAPSKSQFSTLMQEIEEADSLQRSDSLSSPFQHIKIRSEEEVEKRKTLVRALAQTPARLCGILKQTVPMGVAYHNSNLSSEERELIEQAYRQKTLLVLCATSTLSTGVNLPTKAVIFQRPRIGRDLIDYAHYKQMSGRAGRTGFDSSGDSIMICSMEEKRKLDLALSQKQRVLVSAMSPLHLCSSVLELIRLRIIAHQNHLLSFLQQSLLFSLATDSHCSRCSVSKSRSSFNSVVKNLARLQSANSLLQAKDKSLSQVPDLSCLLASPRCQKCIHRVFKACLSFLTDWDMIQLKELPSSKSLNPKVEVKLSKLGDACAESSIPIYSGICHWIECLRLDAFQIDLTRDLLFLAMGLWVSGGELLEPDWNLFPHIINSFTPSEQTVADFFGISEVFILHNQCSRFLYQLPREKPIDEQLYQYSCHKRLWNALILEDLLHFIGPANLLKKYKLTRGELTAIAKNARSQITSTAIFAHHCGFEFLENSLNSLGEQLLPQKVDELSRLPSMDRVVRRALKLEQVNSVDELLTPHGRFRLSLALHKYLTPAYFLLSTQIKEADAATQRELSLKKKVEQTFRGKLNDLRVKILAEAEEMRGELLQTDSEALVSIGSQVPSELAHLLNEEEFR